VSCARRRRPSGRGRIGIAPPLRHVAPLRGARRRVLLYERSEREPMTKRFKVLVVDDSAFARKVVREVLAADSRLEVVGIARDGLDALEKIEALAPDVVTVDLVMPNLDGIGVLDALRERPAAPRVVVVTMTDVESALGVAALAAGAFDVVHKPTSLATDRLYELCVELILKVIVSAE